MLNELPAFDFSILPSKSEGFSNSLLECLGSGLASVAFDVDGNKEAIEDGETGLLVKAQDVEALALAMVEMTEQPEKRQKIKEQHQQRQCPQPRHFL